MRAHTQARKTTTSAADFQTCCTIDDPEQSELMLRLSEPTLSYQTLGERERQRLQILAYQMDGQHHQTGTGEAVSLPACAHA